MPRYKVRMFMPTQLMPTRLAHWHTPRHALGLHVSPEGAQAVWLSRDTDLSVVCQRVWHGPVLDLPSLRQACGWSAGWVSGWTCPNVLCVALDEALPEARIVHVQPTLAAGLSWRDRRFQHMAEVCLQHPEMAAGVCVDEDRQGRVSAIAAHVRTQWQTHARTLGARLTWLGPADSLQPIDPPTNPPTDWRSQEARAHAPLAWQAAWRGLQGDAPRPNWALSPWQLWAKHVGLKRRTVVMAFSLGALGMSGFMFGLQTLAQWREDWTQLDTHLAQLTTQQRELLRWQADVRAEQQAQHQRDAQHLQTWQPMRAHSQASVQWMQSVMDAPGVWIQSLSVQPQEESAEDQTQSPNPKQQQKQNPTPVRLLWQLRGEALSPEHAQGLLQRLNTLPIWQHAPTQRQGHWVHGQDGRLSVWSFEVHAVWTRPW